MDGKFVTRKKNTRGYAKNTKKKKKNTRSKTEIKLQTLLKFSFNVIKTKGQLTGPL